MKYTEQEMHDFALHYALRVIDTFDEGAPSIWDELENWKLKTERK